MQVSYDLFYYEVSSKIVFKLNCSFKESAEIKWTTLVCIFTFIKDCTNWNQDQNTESTVHHSL